MVVTVDLVLSSPQRLLPAMVRGQRQLAVAESFFFKVDSLVGQSSAFCPSFRTAGLFGRTNTHGYIHEHAHREMF